MSSYDRFMAPIESLYLKKIRQRLMKQAKGKVLEIGFGNGANMKYYNFDNISELHALDVSDQMKQFDAVIYHQLSAERLPFEDKSFDTVVLTLALCSIPHPEDALSEIKRVLKDEGSYLFIEHEKPNSKALQVILNLINPLWKRFAGGCQINLETHKSIMNSGFNLDHNKKSVFHYGTARKNPST